MQLDTLVRTLENSNLLLGPVPRTALNAVDIVRVTDKSREVVPGTLFVAYPGLNVDGARFIPDAIQRGAVAVVTQTAVGSEQWGVISKQLSEDSEQRAVNSKQLSEDSERESVSSEQDSADSNQPDVGSNKSLPPIIRVSNGRAALAELSAAFHNFPTRNLRVIGVTGTDGKTTTSTLIENILLAAGHTVGTITTVAAHIGGQEVDTGFHTTTPDAPEIQNYLAQMVERGTEYAVVEATSHGLAQHRLDAVDFDIAVVTNITHEHLDLHGSWENYRDAKAMLFRALSKTRRKPRTAKVAVLNGDDNTRGVLDFLREIPADERIIYTVGDGKQRANEKGAREIGAGERTAENEIWIEAREVEHSAMGLRFKVVTPFGDAQIVSPLIGRYNVSNILAATGAAIGRRIPFDAIAEGVLMTRGVVGRMERMENARGLNVIVDFAHTPNALENALVTAQELKREQGRVIVVFGCAGLRDVQKRAWMGQVAGRNAELTIVTAEDPRTEALAEINAQIEEGLHKESKKRDRDYFVIDDRAQAIDFAINRLAEPNDVVMICGKGHERSMCYGTTEYPWSDQEEARKALGRGR